MSDDRNQESIPRWQWLMCIVGCAVGVVAALLILRIGLRGHTQPTDADLARLIEDPAAIGTVAKFMINGTTIDTHLPRMNWMIKPGDTIDSQTVTGPFDADFGVTFVAVPVNLAYMGVEVLGGSVILLREGRVLLSTYADRTPVTRMTTTPESFGPHQQHVELRFKGDGTGPMHVRALWRPVNADEATSLPSEAAVTRD